MIVEMVLSLIMNYPSLYQTHYYEHANGFSAGIAFNSNDLLLCFMIFCRIHFLIRAILSLSYYSEPRAQRVCTIYGCDANDLFALKALMKESSYKVLMVMLMVSLLMLSYQIKLFEQKVQTPFINITSCAWVILITMTTVGYGDLYPESHCGRVIAIVTAFWGVTFLSLFVVALTNVC
jgi:Ion channel